MPQSDEVDSVFPRQLGSEIDSSLRTMKDLPEASRTQINTHLSNLIKEKRTALAKIKDKPGNQSAYFLIGMLFLWETMRIDIAGTNEERVQSLIVQYKTSEGSMVMGFASIGLYFFEKYKSLGGDDAGYLELIRRFNSKTSA